MISALLASKQEHNTHWAFVSANIIQKIKLSHEIFFVLQFLVIFIFFVCRENFIFDVFIFYGFAICFATGGAGRKLQNHEKRKHQKQNFRERQKNKNNQKQQNKKYFENYFADNT